MPQYLSPGVYVEEMPSAARPIAGVGTSTAGFIGLVKDNVKMPDQPGKFKTPEKQQTGGTTPPAGSTTPPTGGGTSGGGGSAGGAGGGGSTSGGGSTPDGGGSTGSGGGTEEKPAAPEPLPYPVAKAGEPQLITSWGQFKNNFGDIQAGNLTLAHAVYGFFNNGGTRCWVTRVNAETDLANLDAALARLGAIDEISIVAVPGATTETQRKSILAHCFNMKDRFAVLDGATPTAGPLTYENIAPGGRSEQGSYGAVYFPWITVADPASGNIITVPPSGHIAGIYARSDSTRGVHKAPANEGVLGAVGLERLVSKAEQDGLNPKGVNVIRSFDGAVTVWGARTLAGDKNQDFKYISTRRLFMFLSESIDQGTRWVVFEPNTSSLWQSITRNVTAFLTNVWRDGALFGDRPEQAFYVKCDADTNPPEQRELGMVVTEIGVAIVRPAEFVIFRISQWAGPGK